MAGLEDLLEELLAPLGGVTIRRMFGGRGIFKDGLMFALLSSRGVFYFKADDGDGAGLRGGRLRAMDAGDAGADDAHALLARAGAALRRAGRIRRMGAGGLRRGACGVRQKSQGTPKKQRPPRRRRPGQARNDTSDG